MTTTEQAHEAMRAALISLGIEVARLTPIAPRLGRLYVDFSKAMVAYEQTALAELRRMLDASERPG